MKRRSIFLIFSLFSLFLNSCKYDFIIPTEVPPVTGTVSFSTQVVPIFTAGNKCTSCHNTGGQAPDLTAANAYAAIVPGLINTTTADQSEIFSIPAPASTAHTWKKYTAGEAAILLAWIKAGAQKN